MFCDDEHDASCYTITTLLINAIRTPTLGLLKKLGCLVEWCYTQHSVVLVVVTFGVCITRFGMMENKTEKRQTNVFVIKQINLRRACSALPPTFDNNRIR